MHVHIIVISINNLAHTIHFYNNQRSGEISYIGKNEQEFVHNSLSVNLCR